MQLYPSSHFWFLNWKQNSFLSRTIRTTFSYWSSVSWGHWPSGKSVALSSCSAYGSAAISCFTHLPGPLCLHGKSERSACLVPPLGYPDNHVRRDFIQQHFDIEGAEYIGNLMKKYNVSFFTARLCVLWNLSLTLEVTCLLQYSQREIIFSFLPENSLDLCLVHKYACEIFFHKPVQRYLSFRLPLLWILSSVWPHCPARFCKVQSPPSETTV